jgi:hypothetical protein
MERKREGKAESMNIKVRQQKAKEKKERSKEINASYSMSS